MNLNCLFKPEAVPAQFGTVYGATSSKFSRSKGDLFDCVELSVVLNSTPLFSIHRSPVQSQMDFIHPGSVTDTITGVKTITLSRLPDHRNMVHFANTQCR